MDDAHDYDPLFDVPETPEALRGGLEQLDTAESLAATIEQVSAQIETGLARVRDMRGFLPSDYHSSFDAIVERGYLPTIESMRRTIRDSERAIEDLESDARSAAERADDP